MYTTHVAVRWLDKCTCISSPPRDSLLVIHFLPKSLSECGGHQRYVLPSFPNLMFAAKPQCLCRGTSWPRWFSASSSRFHNTLPLLDSNEFFNVSMSCFPRLQKAISITLCASLDSECFQVHGRGVPVSVGQEHIPIVGCAFVSLSHQSSNRISVPKR